jgi:hypothetical protein
LTEVAIHAKTEAHEGDARKTKSSHEQRVLDVLESMMSIQPPGNPAAFIGRMLSSSHPRPAIFPTDTGNQPVIAAMFATIPNPSQLAQSYGSQCNVFSRTTSGIHTTFGASGLVEMSFNTANNCLVAVPSVGADETTHELGFPVFLSGTINNLAVYGTFLSGNQFRCLDTTNTAAVQDNTFVRAYYDLAHDAIIIGNGTTKLSVTCSISIPAGDDVQSITVLWVKS